jgi:hypothetical protein
MAICKLRSTKGAGATDVQEGGKRLAMQRFTAAQTAAEGPNHQSNFVGKFKGMQHTHTLDNKVATHGSIDTRG